ncbi:MAG: cation diffusion facilitator family transporter [Elusimicrobiaceae bacterium]|nr:cation diffusion facilitator family transporter [Elusimicrobiaceae bacterium]
MSETVKLKKRAAAVSVCSNLTLVSAKLMIGLVSGSVSVISEAIHSAVDLLAALIAYFAVSTSSKPADAEHSFGHGKYENVSGVAEALLIFIAAVWIIYEAVHKLVNPRPVEAAGLAAGVMAVSAVANIMVSRLLFRVGKQTDSVALVADAWHLLTDVYTSAGVMFALAVIWAGGIFAPSVNLGWVDPVAAIVVALMIMKAALELTLESSKDLLDHRLPESEEAEILHRMTALRPALVSFKNLRTRKAGHMRFISIDAVMPAEMTVEESHRITDLMSDKIGDVFPDALVTVHVEPCRRPQCPDLCRIRCCIARADNRN